jgi:hypothetical protein
MSHLKKWKRKHKKKSIKGKIVYVLVASVLIILLLIYFLNTRNQTQTGETKLKAAIVDQLNISYPNQTFWQTAQNILSAEGYKVYYYYATLITVDFYRNLAAHGFDIIILRVHSALAQEQSDILALFTSELYDENKARTNYLWDVLASPPRLVKAHASAEEPEFFAITPQFIKDMPGRFDNSIIIMMGCDGLTYTTMADAFIKKGAKVYISWDGPVSASHTDHATTHLLRYLVTEKQTVRNAVTQTNNNVGADPSYGSKLSWYPSTEGEYHLSKFTERFAEEAQNPIMLTYLSKNSKFLENSAIFRSHYCNVFYVYNSILV